MNRIDGRPDEPVPASESLVVSDEVESSFSISNSRLPNNNSLPPPQIPPFPKLIPNAGVGERDGDVIARGGREGREEGVGENTTHNELNRVGAIHK